jgi:hypothetical protein
VPQAVKKNNIRAGNPAAPGDTSLPLLPLGPGGVRKAPPRRTHPDGASILDVSEAVNSLGFCAILQKGDGSMTSLYQINSPVTRDPRLLKLRDFLTNKISLEMADHTDKERQERGQVRKWLMEALQATPAAEMAAELRDQVVDAALAEVVGYGPLELLLAEPDISEIMVNGAKSTFIERNGELFETDVKFDSDEHLMRIIGRIVSPLGRRVDNDNPTADARLPDGSRVNVVIPPVAVDGPHLTIRKFLQTKMDMQELIELQALTPYMAKFLEA